MIADVDADSDRIGVWGVLLHDVLARGGTLFVASEGGLAEDAARFVSDLRIRITGVLPDRIVILADADPAPLDEATGADALLVFSAQEEAEPLLALIGAAKAKGVLTWALTGRWPNPIAAWTDDSFCVGADDAGTVRAVQSLACSLLASATARG